MVIVTNAEGFLVDPATWNETVAVRLAEAQGLALSEAHWEIIRFIRHYYLRFGHLPNMRMFVKALQKELGSDKIDSSCLHRLFPDSPLKTACLIAGTPKPPGCI
ncbi:TusE/DsrC/DsvC family sulfur relay protein [Candidatus Woesearchaeota archaeon]|jgi:tRNA 2-thiouridine synthesizing protein E|nr:TusE/DsrC/DsvC family sulfur relay protein [Candidatus Woesearchaeota archaeon]